MRKAAPPCVGPMGLRGDDRGAVDYRFWVPVHLQYPTASCRAVIRCRPAFERACLNWRNTEPGLQSALTTGAATIPAVSQPYHAFPAPSGSRGSPKDTSLADFVFARTTRESVGHGRTRHRHGSGP